MTTFKCEHCGSDDLIIVQTISSGPVYYSCKKCKKETVVNQELLNKIISIYEEYTKNKNGQETQEEQSAIGVYV